MITEGTSLPTLVIHSVDVDVEHSDSCVCIGGGSGNYIAFCTVWKRYLYIQQFSAQLEEMCYTVFVHN